MPEVIIRTATVSDAELIANISRKTFYETFAPLNTKANMDKFMNEQFTHKALMKQVSEKEKIFFLAFGDGQPAGYAAMSEEDNKDPQIQKLEKPIELARIYVLAAALGKGIGKALMNHCIETALSKKKKTLWLGVWEKNKKAIDFYSNRGFEKFGLHTFLLGDDAQTDWLMKKEL
jgi:diamine N-acetyltransferase